MSLGKLPPELYLMIMGNLESQGQLKSLSSLSRTCPTLYELGNPILYEASFNHESKICAALGWAISRNCTGISMKLIEYGMPVNELFQEDAYKYKRLLTPLAMAAEQGRTEIVRQLLNVPEINVNVICAYEKTALHHAVISRNVEIVNLLLAQEGILIDAKCDAGLTPLSLAVSGGNADIVRLLLAQGPLVDPDSRSNRGWSPLFIAVEHEVDAEVVKLLLDTGRVDVNFIDPVSRFTPLIVAVQNNLPDIARLLVSHPTIDPNLGAHNNQVVPIATAASRGFTEIVRILLSHPQTDPDRAIMARSRAILQADIWGHEEIVSMLLADGRVGQESRQLLQGQRILSQKPCAWL
ncbi:Ankyrin repeat and protein kinase domain-containing protein 1 [Trichoderma ghanense]|uniref:Ankyrin repeat and protein kinase domain-containing protein 1 n=1 Tax=Trichoderma ghanense TaxID=65468 RepID=A0ABY2GST3_9HYPO